MRYDNNTLFMSLTAYQTFSEFTFPLYSLGNLEVWMSIDPPTQLNPVLSATLEFQVTSNKNDNKLIIAINIEVSMSMRITD